MVEVTLADLVVAYPAAKPLFRPAFRTGYRLAAWLDPRGVA